MLLIRTGLRVLLNEMLAAGLARREGERGRRGYRWYPTERPPLDGPIADLERRYRDDGSGGNA